MTSFDVTNNTHRIMSMSGLDEVMQILAGLKAADRDIKQRADAQYEQIKRWEDAERGRINEDINYFEGLVHEYHMRLLAENPQAKTLSTPFGKSKSRISREQPEKKDEKALLEHVLTNNMQDYIKKEVKWGDLKKNLKISEVDGKKVAVDENGVIVPGVSIKPETTSFTLEVPE